MANKTLKTNNRARQTSVAIKMVMALSGIFFVLFLVLHSYGNLKVFSGQEVYDGYALHLRTFLMPILPYKGLLWILRLLLIFFVSAHIISAFYLWYKSNKARGSRYVVKKSLATSYAARTMRWGGVLIGAFVVMHLLHFTGRVLKLGADTDAYGSIDLCINDAGVVTGHAEGGSCASGMMIEEGHPYAMMFTTFSEWYMVLIYAVCVAAVALHISHGVWSALQTWGWLRRTAEKWVMPLSGLVGFAVFAMFMAPPVAILAGLVPAPVM